ncbi:MAG: hypothetical protein GY792_13365 [Gammaproteobacteria bacterium]|nr:hypothetical protein [Gammaproteobacteria bacterium]
MVIVVTHLQSDVIINFLLPILKTAEIKKTGIVNVNGRKRAGRQGIFPGRMETNVSTGGYWYP